MSCCPIPEPEPSKENTSERKMFSRFEPLIFPALPQSGRAFIRLSSVSASPGSPSGSPPAARYFCLRTILRAEKKQDCPFGPHPDQDFNLPAGQPSGCTVFLSESDPPGRKKSGAVSSVPAFMMVPFSAAPGHCSERSFSALTIFTHRQNSSLAAFRSLRVGKVGAMRMLVSWGSRP